MKTLLPLVSLLFTAFASAAGSDGKDEPPSPPRPPAFKAPKGWKAEKAGPVVSARFRIGEGDAAVGVTVTALDKRIFNVTPNVNRWRGELGLGPLDAEGAKKSLRPAKVGGIDGHALDVSGPGADGKPGRRTLVAFVTRGEHVWFFKMSGLAPRVEEQKGPFEAFLKSARFAGPEKK